MKRTAVLNVVGLTPRLLEAGLPRLKTYGRNGALAVVEPALPAVTCTAQSNYLTGCPPSQHGIVGNGWYHRDLGEVQFWKQSNRLVQAPKLWETLRSQDPQFTCAYLFWWHAMYSSADYSITPRPIYPADGRKIFDIYTWPYAIRPEIKKDLGEFPFPSFWGPAAGVDSPQGPADAVSRWIAAAAKWIEHRYRPTLTLVYLPHLDYNLQRFGPSHPAIGRDLGQIDAMAGDLIDFFQARDVQVIVLSEYGITPVSKPIHLNRITRAALSTGGRAKSDFLSVVFCPRRHRQSARQAHRASRRARLGQCQHQAGFPGRQTVRRGHERKLPLIASWR